MEYTVKTIRHLTKLILGDDTSRDWLQKHNFPELILLHFSIEGNDEALKKLIQSKHVEIAAFAQAVLDDKQAFNALAKNKKYTWAATVKVAYKDKKAEEWLLRYDLAHYAALGRAIGQKLKEQSGNDTLGMMKKFITILKKPFNR